jgi:OmpR-family two-component system manganese-sensing sensor histidine kinase
MNPLFQSTRLRLAVWYTTVTAILLLLFATGVYLYVRHTLIERIDDTLKHVVEVVDRSLIIQPLAASEGKYFINLEASFHHNVDAVEDDRIDLEWFSSEGKLLWSTFSEPLNIPLHPQRSGETVHVTSNYLLRQVTEKIEVNHKILGYLRVSHPWFEVTKPIRQLTRDLAIGISLMVLCVGGIGWLLSGIAIEPIRASYQSLKQFTADASHELRNPIATIQTNVQMALAYPEAEPQLQQRQLRAIERLTQRLGRLVNDLLFLARSDSGMVQTDWQPVPLDALLIEVIEEQRVIAEQKGIFLSLHIVEPENSNTIAAEDIFTIQGDWDQLARLFTNLIANAIAHTPSQDEQTALAESCLSRNIEPSVEIELKQIKKSSRDGVTLPSRDRSGNLLGRDRSSYLQVKVKDTGIGIAESDLPHIFDRFYRVDPARTHNQENSVATGAGLGLAIAQAIVENHQGQITVASKLNSGTTFTVILPAK